MTDRDHDAFPRLEGTQAQAADPDAQIWLGASAGSGKTQVLTARVLRLLMAGVAPEAILCLTFTKAGAAEMAERIHSRLGAWVRLSRGELVRDLMNLREAFDDSAIARARTLFARVLDARGGGLRIQTIHGFCQTLLSGFPAEADLVPGFRPIEGREEAALRQTVLADLIANATARGEPALVDRLRALALQLGEDAARGFLSRCAASAETLQALGAPQAVGVFVRRALSGGIDDIAGYLVARCADATIDRDGLMLVRRVQGNWLTKARTPRGGAEDAVALLTLWLASPAEARVADLEAIRAIWRTQTGEWRKAQPDDPDYLPAVERLDAWLAKLIDLKAALAIAPRLTDALILGQAYARAYADAKRAHGVVDFGDMIARTVKLLQTAGMGDWVRYKLDQATDHVLIDEAQDTNAAQWDIVKALAGEFFAGEGAKGKTRRTLFAVGDYKQAIFSFQGSDPDEFNAAHDHFAEAALAADDQLHRVSIAQSFRSSAPILEVVDKTLDGLGHEAIGLPRPDPQHQSAKGGSGSVTLWPPTGGAAGEDDPDVSDDAEQWLDDSVLAFARQLAQTIKGWISGGLTLRNQNDRVVQPQDVLILLRSRGELARLIVSRLHEAGVPVAGVDRLRLDAPIAVMDLLACMRFATQPDDDLTLAALLVSPLVGWSQDVLFARAYGRKGTLWAHLRGTCDDAALAVPRTILGIADMESPHRFLEAILSGPIRGRAKLIARLGEEARDPIEELLNQALAFEHESPPTLQLFLDWFDHGEVEIKRDPSKPEVAVRVMTVHGAKGLQAPVVVLADATRDPDNTRARTLDWEAAPGIKLPLFRPPKATLTGALKAAAEFGDARARQEHWRLLYVALTRAEEHCFIGGAITPSQVRKGLGPDCWHSRVGEALRALGAKADETGAHVHQTIDAVKREKRAAHTAEPTLNRPDWLDRVAPEEARPPRPLAPSKNEAEDTEASPPPDPAMRAAALRGNRLHALFERLPAVAPERRQAAAERWLAESAGVTDPAERDALVADALSVIVHPDFAPLFGHEALAEAPLAGVVEGRVIAGTADRLLITDDQVLVVDFKTGRRVPRLLADAPEAHLAQVAAYAAVLRGIFPDRPVQAGLLYTSGPKLLLLDAATLAAYKPGYRDQQDKLGTSG